MIKIGIIGCGKIAQVRHIPEYAANPGAQLAAYYDLNPARAVELAKKYGGKAYGSVEELLADKHIDAVSVCTSNVTREKPMALNTVDCDAMMAAAEDAGKVLQIGHCVRFWPQYAKTREIVASGQYGRVLAASFRRLGSPPTWSADNWFLDEQRSGGVALDLHIHDTDYVQYLFGMPKAVCSRGSRARGGHLIHIATLYEYADDKVVVAEGGWGMAQQFGFEMSFNIVLEGATIVYDLTRDPMFKVCPVGGQSVQPAVGGGDGYILQVEHFLKCVTGKDVPPVTTLEQSRNSVRIVEAEKQSLAKGNRIAI